MTRRDKCYLAGKRARLLTPDRAVKAWMILALELEDMGSLDMPKFYNLIRAIRRATIKSNL